MEMSTFQPTVVFLKMTCGKPLMVNTLSCPSRVKKELGASRCTYPGADNCYPAAPANNLWICMWLRALSPHPLNINTSHLIHLKSLCWSRMVSWYFNCRFIARPCAMGLKIQTNGPQKAQPNAILEKVFTAITKVAHVFSSLFFMSFVLQWKLNLRYGVCVSCLASTQMRRGWRACPSSSTGMCGPSSAGSDNAGTRRSPALSHDSVKACKENHF